MLAICGIIDVQGFINKNTFVPRELTIIGKDFYYYREIDTDIYPDNYNFKDKKTNYVISKYKTGLKFHLSNDKKKQCLTQNNVHEIIWKAYDILKEQKNDIFAIKNKQLGTYLQSIGIPFIELYNCPSILSLKRKYPEILFSCSNHIIKGSCADYKCKLLYKWLQSTSNRNNHQQMYCNF